jgi:hypothetical protein
MKRLSLIILFPVAQIILALCAGYFALNFSMPADAVRRGAVYSGADFSGLNIKEAAAAIEIISENQMNKGMSGFSYEDTEFIFYMSDIGLTADYSELESILALRNPKTYLYNLLSAFTKSYGRALKPVYTADADAFRKKLNQIRPYVDKKPVNADIFYSRDGGIVRTPAEQGTYLDIDGNFDLIYAMFLSDPLTPFAIDSVTMLRTSALSIEDPLVTDSLLVDIDTALAHVITPIPEGYDLLLAEYAAESINKVWAPGGGMANAPVSFLRYIREAGLPAENPAPEYNLVASALFHALLVSGIDYSKMDLPVSNDNYSYGELPGYGVGLLSNDTDNGDNKQDFLFSNTLNGHIVIFSFVEDGNLEIIVAGNSKSAGRLAAPYEIRSEIIDGRALLYRNGKKIAEYK